MPNEEYVLRWKALVSKSVVAIVGGDLEIAGNETVSRGPISAIFEDEGVVTFTLPWCAQVSLVTRKWEVREPVRLHITMSETKLISTSEGRAIFVVEKFGACVIFPRGDCKLDGTNVKGLPRPSERLLALYPHLAFDRDVAEDILRRQKKYDQLQELISSSPSVRLRDVITTFKEEEDVERFLLAYIKRVTRESPKIY